MEVKPRLAFRRVCMVGFERTLMLVNVKNESIARSVALYSALDPESEFRLSETNPDKHQDDQKQVFYAERWQCESDRFRFRWVVFRYGAMRLKKFGLEHCRFTYSAIKKASPGSPFLLL